MCKDAFFVFFRSHAHLEDADVQEEVDDESEDGNNESQRSTPSPSVSTASASGPPLKRSTIEDGPDLATTLNLFISSRINAHQNINPAKRKLMTFFDDISETMLKFSELEQAEVKREIFNIVIKKELEILRKKLMLEKNAMLVYNCNELNPPGLVPIHNSSQPFQPSNQGPTTSMPAHPRIHPR